MKVLIASNNLGKVREFKKLLDKFDIEFTTLKELNCTLEPVENGKTLIENALIKAKYYFDLYQMPVIADDTGLFIKGLNNEPGIYAARYSGKGDQENRNKVLKNLTSVDRSAYFETALIYYDGVDIVSSVGRLFGEISHSEKGHNGFGYDSIFYIPKLNKTLAEIDEDTKNEFSHRHNAIVGLAFKLTFMFNKDNHINYLTKLFKQLYPNDDIKIIHKLSGGMSNDTYLVETNTFKKVVRIPGNSADVYVDRLNELNGLKLVENNEHFIQYDYFDLNTGVKISPFIEQDSNEIDYLGLANRLEELHHYEGFTNKYLAFDKLEYYISLNNIFNVKLGSQFEELYDKLLNYKQELINRPLTFCHNDNQLSNFILGKKGYTLIDFEFVGLNDPLFDFACFGNNDLEIGKKAFSELQKRPLSKEEEKVIELWYSVQALNWFLVATFKHYTGMSERLGLNFLEIATMFLTKANNLLKKY
ncbi:MAG: RdgB/HAM1 family non-canonical purine NTP pyrophosphatase [Bacilli bacterium]|nr:RdgB/HAM1 family non-canonical purine NTP pyrophosphatase [Bacilli bacterium]